jgi:pyrroline-5-carboxylate reductase
MSLLDDAIVSVVAGTRLKDMQVMLGKQTATASSPL